MDAATLPSAPDLDRLMSRTAYAAALAAGKLADGSGLAKDILEVEMKQAEGKARRFEFTLSTGALDRDRDTIEPKGWVLDAYRRNPVWLFAHDTRGTGLHTPVIGVVPEIAATAKALEVAVEYVPAHINPIAESLVQMHLWRLDVGALQDKGGAVSVGFMPLKMKGNDDGGLAFTRQELWEGSDVPIGSNPEALQRALGDGVDLGPVAEWAERYRKLAGAVELDRARAEAIAKALDPSRPGLAVFEMPAEKIAELRQHPQEKHMEIERKDLFSFAAVVRHLSALRMLSAAEWATLDDAEAGAAQALADEMAYTGDKIASGLARRAPAPESPPADKTADPPTQTPSAAPDPAPPPAAPAARELTDAEIDQLARRFAEPMIIHLTGAPPQ